MYEFHRISLLSQPVICELFYGKGAGYSPRVAVGLRRDAERQIVRA